MKKIPVFDIRPGKFGIDQALGSLTISEEMEKRIASLAYNINSSIVLHPVVKVNSGEHELMAFNVSYDPALSKNEAVSEKGCSRERCKCNDVNEDIAKEEQEDDINQMAQKVHNLAVSKGWHDDNETEDSFLERTCNNMHDEVSELHEAWRNNKLHDLCDKADEMEKNNIKPLTYIEEELADIIIRAMDSAVKLGVDIGDAINRKHLYNSTRKQRHGGKRS